MKTPRAADDTAPVTKRDAQGFTLVELLVAVAVLAILLGTGVPSFVEMVRDSRIGGDANALARALHLARSEAVKRAEFVTVCPRGGSGGCGGAGDWSDGWIAFVDPTADGEDGVASLDADDEVLARGDPIGHGNSLLVYGVRGSGDAPIDPASYLRFHPPGETEWSEGNRAGSLLLCDGERGASAARVINVRLSGDVRRGRPSGDGTTVPNDARNLPVACPERG